MPASAPETTPAGALTLDSNARFVNQGIFFADERTSIVGQVCCTSPVVFDSTGYFAVAPDGATQPGTFVAKGIKFQTNGEVHAERGTLEFRQGLGLPSDGLKVAGNGSLRVTDRTIMGINGARPGLRPRFQARARLLLQYVRVRGAGGQGYFRQRGPL
jgi:hypothetical protein